MQYFRMGTYLLLHHITLCKRTQNTIAIIVKKLPFPLIWILSTGKKMLAGRKFCNTNFKVLTHYDHLNETRAEEEAEVDKNSFWYSCHQLSRCESLFKG